MGRSTTKENGVKWNKTYSLEHEHILSGIIKCHFVEPEWREPSAAGKTKRPVNTKMIFITDVCIGRKWMKNIFVTTNFL